jgi:hypothetical protein
MDKIYVFYGKETSENRNSKVGSLMTSNFRISSKTLR